MDTMTKSHMTTLDVSLSFNSDYKAINNQDMLEVIFKYPESWNKPRFFKNGEKRLLARETAELFVKSGIANYPDTKEETSSAILENGKQDPKEQTSPAKKVAKK